MRFVEDNWESPVLGAWGLGWEVWLDGMEITQVRRRPPPGSRVWAAPGRCVSWPHPVCRGMGMIAWLTGCRACGGQMNPSYPVQLA